MDGPDNRRLPDEAIPYIYCDPCIDNDCANCIGLTHTRPFCGHRCGWTETIDAEDTPALHGAHHIKGEGMATVADVLKVAESQVGYVESGGRDGHSGNITRYWAELAPGLQGQPWCAGFVRWTDKHAGGPLLPIQNPYYCPSIVTYARQHGLWTQHGKAGDYVLCDFNGHGVAEHIGRLRVDYDGRATHQVDGNTSSDDLGSQANGGGVYNKVRGAGVILGFLAYSTLLAAGGAAPRNPVKHNPYPLPHGVFHRGQNGAGIQFIQWAVGVPVDGQLGVQTEHAIRVFQQYHGLTVDGQAGPQTLAALAKITH